MAANMQLAQTSRGLRCSLAGLGAPQRHGHALHEPVVAVRQPRRVAQACSAYRRGGFNGGFNGFRGGPYGADLAGIFNGLAEMSKAFEQAAADYEAQNGRAGQRWTGPNSNGGADADAEPRDAPGCVVPVDVVEYTDSYQLSMDCPGLEKSDIKIQVMPQQRRISISGERKRPQEAEGADAPVQRRYERTMGRFSRTLRLAKDLDIDSLTARVEKGVLHVSARKLPAEQPPSDVVEVSVN